MSRRTFAITIGMLLAAGAAQARPVDVIVDSGPAANRINMVILGEGYTSSAADQAKLKTDAENISNNLFNLSPYQDFKGLFNVKLVHSVSQTSTIPKNGAGSNATAFGCYYGCAGIDRLICCGTGSEGSVFSAAAADVPEVSFAVVVVNDQTYGGSGGAYAVISTNASATEIARHELGHTVGLLADEYSDPYPGYPACSAQTDCNEPNATLFATRPGKWGQWVDAATPIPTPPGSPATGYVEGCRYQPTGLYRPVDACLMRQLGIGFCPVCAEGLSLAFWNRVEPIDATMPPAETPLVTSDCTTQTFTASVPSNAGTAAAEWKVDGVVQASTATTLMLEPRNVGAGPHSVEVTVRNTSPIIRSDPQMLATATRTWDWTTNCTAPPIDAAPPDGAGNGNNGDGGGCCRVDDTHGSWATALLGGVLVLVVRRRKRR